MPVSQTAEEMRIGSDEKLFSWKAIAVYLDCDERTAKRWEQERGMPVHRSPGGKRGRVMAFASELDSWLNGATLEEDPPTLPATELHLVPSVKPEVPLLPDPISVPHSSAGGASNVRIRAWAICAAVALIVIAFAFENVIPARGVAADESATVHRPSAEAQALFLRGRYYWNLRTAESLSNAAKLFEQAITKDPAYAEAYAALAETYNLSPQFAHSNLNEDMQKAKIAADRAIALNPNLASAHRAKAFALFYRDWDLPSSDAEFRRALELEPGSAESHLWYASVLLSRLDPACLQQVDESLRLSPTSPAIVTDAAFMHAEFERDYDESVKTLHEMERTQPALKSPAVFLSQIAFGRGDWPEYLAALQRLAAIDGTADEKALAAAAARGWAQAGRRGMLEAALPALIAAYQRGTEPGYRIGASYVLLGQPKAALPYFRAALASRYILMMAMPECGWAKKLASDPEYATLFAQVHESLHGGKLNQPQSLPVTFRLAGEQ